MISFRVPFFLCYQRILCNQSQPIDQSQSWNHCLIYNSDLKPDPHGEMRSLHHFIFKIIIPKVNFSPWLSRHPSLGKQKYRKVLIPFIKSTNQSFNNQDKILVIAEKNLNMGAFNLAAITWTSWIRAYIGSVQMIRPIGGES